MYKFRNQKLFDLLCLLFFKIASGTHSFAFIAVNHPTSVFLLIIGQKS